MPTRTRIQLSIMMFFQFFVWGCWNVTMGTYLLNIGFDGAAVGSAYSTTSWGAIFAPILVGMLADRYFSSQQVLAILHLVGAALLWWLSSITEPGAFFRVLLAYAVCYMPTLALANAIAFHQMRDPGKEFPGIRVMGTLGWIVCHRHRCAGSAWLLDRGHERAHRMGRRGVAAAGRICLLVA
jgi:MFS family permease